MSIAETDPETTEAESTATCIRCQTSEAWGESSWCPVCGYYPTVDGTEVDGKSWADDLPDVPKEEAEDEGSTLQSLPGWLWGLLGGIVGIMAFSVAIRVLFSSNEGIRGTIALAQLVIGLVSVLTAHGLAAKFAMKHDRRVNLNDVVLSWFNVWQPNIAALPGTCARIWGVVWGGIAVMTAVTIIGGIDYSAPFRVDDASKGMGPNASSVVGAVAGAAKQAGDDDASLDEALGDLQEEESAEEKGRGNGGSQEMDKVLSELDGAEDQVGETDEASSDDLADAAATIELDCFIYGVVTDSNRLPVSFLFAAHTKGRIRHVAEIRAERLPPGKFRQIAVQLYSFVQAQPEVPTQRKAVWVKPIVTCRLLFNGYTSTGELRKPEFGAVVVAQQGRFETSRQEQQKSTQRQ
ncbi:MAG TPA: hypothetical protein EYG03_15595 [Planctomycetes bacterium]|nr:hypothetical protein [Fuerstiella sp.]HIK93382.1 hypothetical protein [Planctomycetota bacterium]